MTDSPHHKIPSAAKGAARRRRTEGGRQQAVKIRLTEAEYNMVVSQAAKERVSIQRYLIGCALSREPGATAALSAELVALRRLSANMANNLNQIARRLNSAGRPDASVDAAAEAVGRTLTRLDTAISWLGTPPPRSASRPRSGTIPPPPEEDGP
jgi:hypothetical protein